MRRRAHYRDNEVFIVIFVMLMLALITGEIEGVVVLAVLAGLMFMIKQIDGTGKSTTAARSVPAVESRQANAEPVYKHALEAVTNAGHDPDNVQVLPVDIGVMAFKDGEDPVVYRTWAVPNDVDYIQPFVQLRLPTRAAGRVRFEIVDSSGEVIFVHEDNHHLVRGRNLLTPAARLPIHDVQPMDEAWVLRISADGTPLAVHEFDWGDAASPRIRHHLGGDGEISSEMRAVLAESRLQNMSLDDLLSIQDMEASEQQQNR